MLRRKPEKPQSEMSPDEMLAEVRQSAEQALVFAKQGDVAAMEIRYIFLTIQLIYNLVILLQLNTSRTIALIKEH